MGAVELASPVCADSGKGEKFRAPANHEKPLVSKSIVDAVDGEIADRPGVHLPFAAAGTEGPGEARARDASGEDRSTDQELFPVHLHGRMMGEALFPSWT